ncbi:cyclase family protein [Haloarcula sp. S1CR25-12]|uniref:Cyclase family protein n=1 Tax=Haloarcula saliterrae TaxID=2950534 RepID=A0ABU2FGY5_9EURY|nr:cyclase family protein [Haloarcula sp. S1CR25-12]MDS0261523.1 cyclase family protein [Haloarcula sp. S1CR25-12]
MPIADLTRPIDSGMPVFPGDPPVSVDAHATMAADGYRVSALSCGSHTGTHVDAPSHTEADGRTLDEFPVSRFVREAVRVDLRGCGPREPIRPADLPTVDAGAVVLRTGWDSHWGEPRYLDHPYLTPAAARHCVDHGYDVATDALNVDPTPTDDHPAAGVPAHGELLGNDRLIAENLTNLDGLPERFELSVLPMRLDGDGAPVRAVARWD